MKPLVKWVRCLVTAAALMALLLPSVASPGRAQAAPAAEGAFAAGTVVSLKGTPHLWFADERGELHWGGDTRALAGRAIDWNRKVELSYTQLSSLPIGDPWLSAGLLKDGDPIYLVKWEVSDRVPTLLHIQSIADVQIFGINSGNYGRFVLDRAEWERRYGMAASGLPRAELASAAPSGSAAPAAPTAPAPPAAPTAPQGPQSGQVLLSDSLGDAATGVLPVSSSPRYQRGYEGGEYFLRKIDANAAGFPVAYLPGTYRNAAVAVDARLVGDAAGQAIIIGSREDPDSERGYLVVLLPAARGFMLFRSDGDDLTALARGTSPAIRGGNETNRIELSCIGNTILLRVNGVDVASAQDSTYKEGQMWIGVDGDKQSAEARFRNLVVTQR